MAQTAWAREKVLTLDELLATLAARSVRPRVALTNGCFDVLHVGHVRSLEFAAMQADVLIVGVNDDASVFDLKTPDRPIVPETERAEMIAALSCVDFVVIFGERTAERLVQVIQPDVYVKGGDYTLETLPEAHTVQSYGGEVVFSPLLEGRSTTSIINRIRGTH